MCQRAAVHGSVRGAAGVRGGLGRGRGRCGGLGQSAAAGHELRVGGRRQVSRT